MKPRRWPKVLTENKHVTTVQVQQYQFILCTRDFQKFKGLEWRPLRDRPGGTRVYVELRENKRRVGYLHRLIAGAEDGQITDHINGNTRDNRTQNLRTVSAAQNRWNARTKIPASGFYGVSPARNTKSRWRATIGVGRKNRDIGYFLTKEIAALRRDIEVVRTRDEHALTNFPRQDIEKIIAAAREGK